MRKGWLLVMLAGCGRLGFDDLAVDDGVDDSGASLAERQVLYMPFDTDRIDAVSGYIAECSGGDCPSYATGIIGDAAIFDGVDDCLHVPWMNNWVPPQFTISAWVKLENMTAPVVVKQYAGACPAAALQVANRSVGMVMLDDLDIHKEAWTPQLVTPQTWHALTIRWDGVNQEVFFDGTCACAIAPPRKLLVSTEEITVGCYPDQGQFMLGAIDEVRIHDRPLTSDEISELAAMAGQTAPTPSECSQLCATVAP